MQKIVLECPLIELAKLDGESLSIPFEKLKSLEVLHFLKIDGSEFSTVSRIKLIDPAEDIEHVFAGNHIDVKPLIEEDPGTYICFTRGERKSRAQYIKKTDVYFTGPYIIRNEKVTFGILGEIASLRAFMKDMENRINGFKVISVTNGDQLNSSPLQALTGKQREVISRAFRLGYYDMPRKISSTKIAVKLGMNQSTFTEHRRKAEHRIMEWINSNYSL